MAIEISCPSCGVTLRVEDDSAGQIIRCGGCMSTLRVPDLEEPQANIRTGGVASGGSDQEESYPDQDEAVERPHPWRASRQPPPSRGRGPLFWLLVFLGLSGLACCSLCGLAALLLPGPKWHTHTSGEGGFKVELPAPVREIKAIPGVKMDPKMKTEGAFLLSRGEEYAIVYGEIAPRKQRWNTDEEVIAAGVKELESDPDCRRMIRNEPIEVSGFKAHEFEFVGQDGGTRVGRLIVADSRFYVVVAGGRFVRPGNLNVRRFLDSFEVTDPKLRLALPHKVNQPRPAP